MTLSRCVHCGAIAHYAKSVTDPHLCWSVQCSDCGIGTPSYSQQEMAVDAWNRCVNTYAHRNGETTAPIISGEYWFNGVCATHRYPVAYMVDFAGGLVFIGSEPHKPSAFAGQWWGPIVPPWRGSE